MNLERGELLDEYDPALLITHSTGLPFDPEKAILYMDKIEDHILEFSNGREDLAHYYQLLYGYGITGRTDEQLMWCIIGPTGSGKSTTDDARIKAMGDFADAITSDILLKNYSGSKDKFEKETLTGKRTVIAEEPTEGREWSKEEIKSLVGGSSQKVRAPDGQFKTVPIQAKIFLSSNTLPNLNKNDPAIKRRLRFIPADYSFHQRGTANNMKALMLTQEYLEGFQLYMILGAVRYYKEVRDKGLKLKSLEPPCIKNYTEKYYEQEDRLKVFLDENYVVDPAGQVLFKHVYSDWKYWHVETEGHRSCPTKKSFSKMLRERFGDEILRKSTNGEMYLSGFKDKG